MRLICQVTGVKHPPYKPKTLCKHCGQEYGAKVPKRRKRDPLKRRAHDVIAIWIRKGGLLPAKQRLCTDCHDTAAVYHHEDYEKPFEVEPVCHRCNALRRSMAAL